MEPILRTPAKYHLIVDAKRKYRILYKPKTLIIHTVNKYL